MDQSQFLKILLIAILGVIVVLVLVYHVFMFLSFFSKQAPYIGTFPSQLKVMKQQLKLKDWHKLVDLGCWDGRALRFFQRNYNLSEHHGLDLNRFAILRWKFLNKLFSISWVVLSHKDLFTANLSKYHYIYVYLLPHQMKMIESWVFETAKKNTLIISNSFTFKNKTPYKILKDQKWKEIIFLYKVL